MNYTVLVFITGFVIFYNNTVSWLIESWLHNEYYSHGILVPVISGYIIWNLRKELAAIQIKQSQAGLALFAAGIVLQGISVLWTVRFLSGISLLIMIYSVILYLYGWEFIKKIKFPLLFLIFMVPLPFVDKLAPPLQSVSAVASSNAAKIIGIPVVREGFLLTTPGGSFEIGLPCSGINSIISLITVGVIFAFILEGGMLMKYTILVSTIPLALVGNILRIISVLAVANMHGQEIAMNYFHDFSSLLLFSFSLIGLFFVGRCFGRLRFKKMF